ncbi:MAG: amidohydrolase [Proteobacteria bacterium]|nr:amidohydrolase [Pseudomonadota bacterium]
MGVRRVRVPPAAAGAILAGCLCLARALPAAELDAATLDALDAKELPSVIAWRRDIHAHPELGNRETRTAQLVADELRKLGLEVHTGIAHTGVVALLRGARPGPTVAVRADMDALPVTEKTDVPFASHVTTTYHGESVGVMHACGHDAHTAMLLGLAAALSAARASLPGNVLFIFQPAEEGPPDGEEGGAQLMLKEGVFEKYPPQAVFGMHVWAALSAGQVGYRSGPTMAGVDMFKVIVHGKQAHGARPWQAVDPIVTSAQMVSALQTVVSRNVDISTNPAIVTIGAIKGGIRNNIIPADVTLLGTVRTFTAEQRALVLEHMKLIVEHTAAANGATAELIFSDAPYPVTYNDPALTQRVVPSLAAVVGEANVRQVPPVTASEDFAFFAKKVPGFFFFVGITPAAQDPATAPANHSDYFYIDESGIAVGLRAMTRVVVDYLTSGGSQ